MLKLINNLIKLNLRLNLIKESKRVNLIKLNLKFNSIKDLIRLNLK